MDWHSRRITGILENALREDSVTRDATTYACVDPRQVAAATILAKQDCVLAGLGLVARIFDVFAALDGTVLEHPEVTSHPEVFDGVRLHRGQSVAVIRHNARVILSCERVILNFMQRLSGIATLTRRFVHAVSGTRARILDTRKTVPGLRVLDKYAVVCGGGFNHRLDLSDGVLIKNNHIAVAGGIAPALERAQRNRRGEQVIEIEVRSLEGTRRGAHPRRRGRPARQHVGGGRKEGGRARRPAYAPRAAGMLRRDHAGERPRLRRGGRGLHLRGRAHPLRDRGGHELAGRAGLERVRSQ